MNKKDARNRRARKTRVRIALQRATRLVVSRSNCHIYAQIVAPTGDKVLASASTLEAEVRKDTKNGGNKAAAAVVGKRIADRAKELGIESVALTALATVPRPRRGRRAREHGPVLTPHDETTKVRHGKDAEPAATAGRSRRWPQGRR
jgi:large subunit ribosomal protein L18